MTGNADIGTTRRWVAAWALLVAVALPLGLRVLTGGLPTRLVAAEVDALEGGAILGESVMRAADGASLRTRLRDGFKPAPGHPRLVGLGDNDETRGSVMTPPLPRWVAFAGISVVPMPEAATNAMRAGWAATIAVMVVLFLWCLHLGPARAGGVFLVAMAIPEARDAVTGFGYGAAAMLASSLVLIGYGRLAQGPPAGRLGALATAAAVSFGFAAMLGVHPYSFFVLLSVFFVLPLARERVLSGRHPEGGMIAVPTMPVGLIAWPVVGLLLFIGSWPVLWNGTGKRLMAYLLETGMYPGSMQVIVSQGFDPGSDRAPQAFTALLQFVAWLPLPVLALAVVGAFTHRRVRAAVLPFGLAVLLGGFLDGGLNGGRLSLWPFLWLPSAWLAVVGAMSLADGFGRRFSNIHQSLRGSLMIAAALVLAFVLELVGVSAAQRFRTGREADLGLPLALLAPVRASVEANDAPTVIAVEGDVAAFTPAFGAMRDHFEWDLDTGSRDEAGWVFEQRALPFDDAVAGAEVACDGIFTRMRRVTDDGVNDRSTAPVRVPVRK